MGRGYDHHPSNDVPSYAPTAQGAPTQFGRSTPSRYTGNESPLPPSQDLPAALKDVDVMATLKFRGATYGETLRFMHDVWSRAEARSHREDAKSRAARNASYPTDHNRTQPVHSDYNYDPNMLRPQNITERTGNNQEYYASHGSPKVVPPPVFSQAASSPGGYTECQGQMSTRPLAYRSRGFSLASGIHGAPSYVQIIRQVPPASPSNYYGEVCKDASGSAAHFDRSTTPAFSFVPENYSRSSGQPITPGSHALEMTEDSEKVADWADEIGRDYSKLPYSIDIHGNPGIFEFEATEPMESEATEPSGKYRGKWQFKKIGPNGIEEGFGRDETGIDSRVRW